MSATEDELSREAIYNTDRLVSLSDGVYAIALTILVLDIRLPASFDVFSSSSQLLKALMDLETNIFAYIISFIVALFTPRVALLSWILLAVVEGVIGRILRRRWARQEGKVTS